MPASRSRYRRMHSSLTPRTAPDGSAFADIQRWERPVPRCRCPRTHTSTIPGMGGNVIAHTGKKETAASSSEETTGQPAVVCYVCPDGRNESCLLYTSDAAD